MAHRLMDPVLRRATIADLPSVWRVLHAIEYGRSDEPPSLADVPSYLAHELATGEMWVAHEAGQLLGYAAAVLRGDVAIIAELFVSPARQSRGIGHALLQKVLAAPVRSVCTMSSSDPRALGLYVRAGLRPAWPHFQLAGHPTGLAIPETSIEVVDANRGDPEIVAWDAEISGRLRPEDHAYWQTTVHGSPVWCRRRGTVVGYGYVQPHPPSGRRPASRIVGPVGARSPDDAEACVLAVVRAAAAGTDQVHLGVPGMHPGLPALVRAGFQVKYLETFCASAPTAVFDPRIYLPSTTSEGTALL